MLNYLIMGSDGSIGGYTRADLLLIDVAEHAQANDKPLAIWRRVETGMREVFAPSSVDEVRRDLESAKCPECKGINGHASPFCGALDLSETLEAA